MVRTSPPTALLLNGVAFAGAFAGLEGCVVACVVISAAIVCPSLAYQANAYLYLFFCVGTFAAPGVLAYTPSLSHLDPRRASVPSNKAKFTTIKRREANLPLLERPGSWHP